MAQGRVTVTASASLLSRHIQCAISQLRLRNRGRAGRQPPSLSSLQLSRRRLDWLLPKTLFQERLRDRRGDGLQQFLAFLGSCRPRLADDTDERAARKLAPTVDTGIDTRNR